MNKKLIYKVFNLILIWKNIFKKMFLSQIVVVFTKEVLNRMETATRGKGQFRLMSKKVCLEFFMKNLKKIGRTVIFIEKTIKNWPIYTKTDKKRRNWSILVLGACWTLDLFDGLSKKLLAVVGYWKLKK